MSLFKDDPFFNSGNANFFGNDSFFVKEVSLDDPIIADTLSEIFFPGKRKTRSVDFKRVVKGLTKSLKNADRTRNSSAASTTSETSTASSSTSAASSGNWKTRAHGSNLELITDNADVFEIELSADGFDPDELSVSLRGSNGQLVVAANKADAFGKVIKTFRRTYRVPPDCELDKIQSMLTKDGLLKIAAPKRKSAAEKIVVHQVHNNYRSLSERIVKDGDGALRIELDVDGFQAEDLAVKREDGCGSGNGILTILGRQHVQQREQNYLRREFRRQYRIDESELDVKSIKSSLSKAGILSVIVPKAK